jgi:hypothetical protein
MYYLPSTRVSEYHRAWHVVWFFVKESLIPHTKYRRLVDIRYSGGGCARNAIVAGWWFSNFVTKSISFPWYHQSS